MKNKIAILIPILLISSSAFVLFKNQSKQQDSQNNFSNNDNSTKAGSDDQNNITIGFQKLIIQENRCRGCGKCARIDQEHFEMNGQTAQVISSSNLNSINLQQAINICPGQAIALK